MNLAMSKLKDLVDRVAEKVKELLAPPPVPVPIPIGPIRGPHGRRR